MTRAATRHFDGAKAALAANDARLLLLHLYGILAEIERPGSAEVEAAGAVGAAVRCKGE